MAVDSVVRLRREQIPETAAMLARAFDDSPIFRHLLPRAWSRRAVLRSFFRAALRDTVPLGEAYGAVADGQVVGAALWLKPGDYPPSRARELRQLTGTFLLGPLAPRAIAPSLRYLRANEAVHPHDEHWYLGVLGVEPSHQGQGTGGVLLRHGLDRADADGRPTYLETDRVRNLAFYARFRFEERQMLFPDGTDAPPSWTMWRDLPT